MDDLEFISGEDGDDLPETLANQIVSALPPDILQ